MRPFFACALLLLIGCAPRLEFNSSQNMKPDDMLARASLVFVGVIEKQHLEPWPLFRLKPAGGNSEYWRILRREVRVELVLRGTESRKVIDVNEIYWVGGASGDWNSTREGERALFLVRLENGRYHVVRDWLRSIFPVTTGPHPRLPLDDSHALWERIALMNFWVERSDDGARIGYPYFRYSDPGRALSQWRVVKLERGLVRHPSPAIRVAACRELLDLGGWGQDECWEALSEADRAHLHDSGHVCCSASDIAAARLAAAERDASWWWTRMADREERRLLTAHSNRRLRVEFCRMWTREYPGDHDNGCPADQPPPATIVRENGDIPLVGAWPR